MPDFSFEQAHSGYVVGFDEAGCGPWAGPVVAAAAILVKEKFPPELACQINDSKKLTAIKREKIFSHLNILEGESCFLSVGMCSVEEIDALNIREAAIRAMERASRALKLPLSITPSLGLADGTVKPKLPYPVRSLVKGDSLSLSIAAASIVAKVTRDQIMKKLSVLHPEYGWERNAGYGTAYHQSALMRYGVTPHHRKTFAPIARLLGSQ
ncbi:ribonuclease HII [Caedimonas varicaedens]|uniref:Ribonuclease HII n=1 Tax=Caedimonas varicaedens TaxID=1629334 RepID=A0A0K8MD77_9PROT|nr:ribonuclease HII [Caedimonas varicaedens]